MLAQGTGPLVKKDDLVHLWLEQGALVAALPNVQMGIKKQ